MQRHTFNDDNASESPAFESKGEEKMKTDIASYPEKKSVVLNTLKGTRLNARNTRTKLTQKKKPKGKRMKGRKARKKLQKKRRCNFRRQKRQFHRNKQ